ncbi:MAG TPA: sigma-54 dependent transcriptional regulator [Kofleriaceae bacterium]|nr:sigma-54 dependent transcriptional regulator [Kofleriaceae bacterium]
MRNRILIVECDPEPARLLAHDLHALGYASVIASSVHACLERLSRTSVEIALIDAMKPPISGLELCGILRARFPDVLPIIAVESDAADVAFEALRAGAYDCLVKPVGVRDLELVLARASSHLAIHRELARVRTGPLDESVAAPHAGGRAIHHTLELVRRIARSDTTVLVTGASGAGKERIARAIHDLSDRRPHPFVAINCGAVPVSVLESELFGHVSGAFTGASHERVGLLLRAAHGTILLDEVGEMPLEMQAKLLRVLQARTVRPVGGDGEVPFTARVIAATSRDLECEVASGHFRKDLFHRLNVVAIPVPSLRERRDELLWMAHVMLWRCAARVGKPVRGITAAAARALLEYDWPGNVRELENCIERAIAVCRLDHLTIDDLPHKLHRARGAFAACDPEELVSLVEMKRRYLRSVVESCGGNMTQAARILGIDRRTVSHHLADK